MGYLLDFTFRPLASWPYPDTRDRRGYPFKATWSATQYDLRRELINLGASDVLIAICMRAVDIRRDGMPKESAIAFHPGVELSFDSDVQGRRLIYATDVCSHWQQNVRSIALGLEALRAVDRYGITRRGEQYAGFAAITAGGPDPAIGKKLVESAGGMRAALFQHHPDQGGDPVNFGHVQAYRDSIGAAAR